MYFADTSRGRPFSKDPAVVTFRERYWMYYSKPPFGDGRPGEWNQSESGHPFCFQDRDGCDYLFFQGNADNGKTWYLSKVEIGWKDGLPVIAG
jgi:hypothetical protein